MLVRPRNFQPGKKYPVLVHVYGGPHHNQVMSVAGMYMLDQWLADHGFIVFMADGRGTGGRGTTWEQAISGNFGDIPLDDQVAALQAAGERFPEMDLSRVGVFGWSFGGYMAALAVLRRPDVFHVGVAGAPVVDWRDYDTCYTERYISTPKENPDGYDRSSLLTYAPQLRRPLLLIHGTADDNVLFFHSLKLSQALFRAGKPHELLPLPGLTHMVPDPVITERMWGRIVGAFAAVLHPELEHLAVKPGSGAPPLPEPIPAAPAGNVPKKPLPRR
jgi:dipeptidyl-peptidase-4